jgi:hypothetical protein
MEQVLGDQDTQSLVKSIKKDNSMTEGYYLWLIEVETLVVHNSLFVTIDKVPNILIEIILVSVRLLKVWIPSTKFNKETK